MDIKPVIRANVDGTFILRETNPKLREKLYNNYCNNVNEQDFYDIMDAVTDDYGALYVHNRSTSNNPEDCMFYYKADPKKLINFKFGCREFWDFHKDRYDPNYIDPII
jgi:hypothetical protein